MDGDKCSMPRDCCEAHECTEGDWSANTDYACRRIGHKPSDAEFVQRLRRFYQRHNPEKLGRLGADAVLESMLDKWRGREERLFYALRQKYSVKEEL